MANISASNDSLNSSDSDDWKLSDKVIELFRKFGMAEGIVRMVCNTLAWLVILRTKNLHNMTNYLLAYLAVIDSLSCFFIIFTYATYEISVPPTFLARELYCRLIYNSFSPAVTASVSSFTLCVVTYERYIGIVHPLHYHQMMSTKKVTVVLFMTWMISLLLSSPRLFALSASEEATKRQCYHNPHGKELLDIGNTLYFLFIYLLPILFMSWAYYKIQATLKRSAHELQQQNVQAAGDELLRARQKVVNMLMIVMGAMIVFWTPLILKNIYCIWNLCNSKTAWILHEFSILLYCMNSVINPIVYVFKYKKFRNRLKDMICCCIGLAPRPNRIGVEIAMDEHNA